ncbi:PREDICTED: F-box [Prunus dulcis]|uniref:PREDICTED: F-box n=1 Tax=Prunus dulcis TaxID=3755 RepID=A0A5E4FYM8_PRUDU|nr:F-box/kelch-repeat protein At3g06240-like [Prunus dulcis]VVA32468.1 PREDICTED: F-box [Prunus dulcis]
MKSGCDYLLVHSGNRDCLSVFCPETYAKCLELNLPRHKSGSSFHIYGSCNGLLCISDNTMKRTYLWNPSIRKFKRLPKSLNRDKYRYSIATIALGFGLDVGGNDYKVVRIASFSHGICVEVYSLRLDSWRIINALPPVTSDVWNEKWAYLNGVVYWIVQEFSPDWRDIISFDMENEVFQRIMLPDRLLTVTDSISIRVLEKSLSLFHHRKDWDRGYRYYYDIWVLAMDSWKMIRTIPLPAKGKIAWPLAFTANGGVHFTMRYENWQHRKLRVVRS